MFKPLPYLLLYGFISFFSPLAHSEPTSLNSEPAAHANIHKLSNSALLQRLSELVKNAKTEYQAEARAFSKFDILYQKARADRLAFNLSEKKTTEINGSLETLKYDQQQLSGYLQAQETLLELMKLEIELLGKKKSQANALYVETNKYSKKLKNSALIFIEIDLRLADKSLTKKALQGYPKEKEIRNTIKTLTKKENEVKEIIIQTTDILGLENLNLDKLRLDIQHGEEGLKLLKTQITLFEKRNIIKEKYKNKSIEFCFKKLDEMQTKRIWLNGSFSISSQSFNKSDIELKARQSEFDKLSEVEVEKWRTKVYLEKTTDLSDLHEVELLLEFYDHKISHLESFKLAAEKLKTHAKVLFGDEEILRTHLFNMQVIVEIISEKITEENADTYQSIIDKHHKELSTSQKQLGKHELEVKSQLNAADTLLENLEKYRIKYSIERENIVKTLDYLKKLEHSERNVSDWEAKLQTLGIDELIEEFKTRDAEFKHLLKVLPQQQQQVTTALSEAEQIEYDLAHMQSPIMQKIMDEHYNPIKKRVTEQLYTIAGFKLPHQDKDTSSYSDTSVNTGLKKTDESGNAWKQCHQASN